jgi:hypothetical protein
MQNLEDLKSRDVLAEELPVQPLTCTIPRHPIAKSINVVKRGRPCKVKDDS